MNSLLRMMVRGGLEGHFLAVLLSVVFYLLEVGLSTLSDGDEIVFYPLETVLSAQ